MLFGIVLLSFTLPLAASGGLSDKLLFFPYVSANSYVKLTPQLSAELDAFTVCMRLSVNPHIVNVHERETILFAYRTEEHDELNVWAEKSALSFYLGSSSESALYRLPRLTLFRTNLCLTWDSDTGLAAFWDEARRTTLQIYKPKHKIAPGGVVFLGQDPDTMDGGFDIKQSFVGEITDVNMWDYVLTSTEIRQFNDRKWTGPKGNVLNWDSVEYEAHGQVMIVSEP